MKKKIFIFIMIFMMLFPYVASSQTTDEWKKLDQISDEALQLAKNKRFEEAKQVLAHFSEEFFKLNARERLKSMDELRVITVTHESALKTVTASTLPAEERVERVTRFRLVIDAVRSDHQPLWSEMEHSIMDAFYRMKKAVENGNMQAFQSSFQQFLNQYEMIEPSVKIDVTPERFKRVDANIELLEAPAFSQLSSDGQMKQLLQMEQDLQALFDDVKKDEADPSLWWVIISTGSIIILTLSYVGWRKYRGEKEQNKLHEKE
ncbi:sporulation protein YpjB [Anoxybacillus calidus]|jgi:sporulation protein YpjB|uniref:Sporulation protein YpjB n=1 Tax=[Anoxybacillus] calidus TaxID=575178 RepID=A0A7V9YXD6_9BACL|nr:sporulation protein YpjB [Anoxybacillus calidus]MBA2870196.1 sporulation protein YpjB [Anoxybacillus calidus]